MSGCTTLFAGIEIPSCDGFFLAITIGLHIPLGLCCVLAGAAAMLVNKGRGRHSTFGTVYFWSLAALFASVTVLSVMRWTENYHLFTLGALSFTTAVLGREALRQRWPHWVMLHIAGMGLSFVLMLIAFYVDNGKQLPLWKELPQFTYWAVPLVIGLPLILRALLRHPLARLER
jgi:hypothetical protein